MNSASSRLRISRFVAFTAITLIGSIFITASAAAQQAMTAQAAPTANPSDVASMDSIIAALYDVISGPAGKKREWDRFRSLFIPGARLIPTGPRQGGGVGSTVIDPEGYITRSSAFLEEQGFFEKEIARRTETFGNIAHVFSTYEARRKAEDKEPFMRGINSIQLMNDGKRWWIVTVFWEAESKDTPLPKKYLENKN